ncbi:MAG TPA: membrane protein insertion efficiency factor YidD [Candidatus Andersenbacteria bacterium]|nr:membrane protein insertion efficiency factor YidD [Candidatus Andersenbacteria bacterium]
MQFNEVVRNSSIRFLLVSIAIYQRTLSPDHGIFKYVYGAPVCRFYPTCSEYTAQSIRQFGFKGIWMGIKRIARCNPFSTSL